jgi:hypothetical protein
VSLAAQVHSHTAAASMMKHVKDGLIPPEALQAAIFLEEVNALWDFVNSSSQFGPPDKGAVNIAT